MYAIFSFSSTGDKMDYLATNFHHLIPHVAPDVGNNIIAELRAQRELMEGNQSWFCM